MSKGMEKIKQMTKLQKTLAALLISLVLYTLTGFFAAPPLVKSILAKKLSENLNREVSIEKIKINPFILSADAQGFVIKTRNGEKTFLSFQELYLNLQSISIFKGGLILKEIRLDKPYVNIQRDTDGSYNFSDLLQDDQTGPQSESEPFLFSLNHIQILNGGIDFSDGPKKTKHTVRDLVITIPFLSNLPYDIETFVLPSFQATINDMPFTLTGQTKPFADSLETVFAIDIKDLNIPHYLSYIPYEMNFKIGSAIIGAKGDLSFIQYKNRPSSLVLKGDFSLSDIKILNLQDKLLAAIPSLNISLLPSELLRPKINLARVLVQSPDINVRRDKSGKIQLPFLTTTVEIVEEEVEKGLVLTLNADEIQIEQGKLTYTDYSFPSNFITTASPLDLKILHFSTEKDKESAVELSLKTESGEEVKLTGDFTVIPVQSAGTIELKQIIPKKYSPYYDENIAFRVREGTVDARSKYTFSMVENRPLIKTSDIEIALRSVKLRRKDEEVDFVNIPVYTLKKGEIDFAEKVLTVGEVYTKNGTIVSRRNKDGTLSMQRLLPKLAQKIEGEAEKKAEKPWIVLIKKMVYENHTINFEDLLPDEPVNLTASEIRLKAENISTKKDSRGALSYSFKLNDRGTVSVKSSLGINPVSSDISLSLKDIDVIPFQPYIADKIKILITGGAVSAKGDLSYGLSAGNDLSVTYKGKASLTGFSSVDKKNANDFLKWDSFYLNGIDAGLNPFYLNIREIALADFYSRLIINPDGTLNVQDVLEDEKGEQQEPELHGDDDKSKAIEVDAMENQIQVEEVTLQGGTVNFSDRHIQPNYSVNFLEVGGRISGLSSSKDSMADIDMRGKLENYAPLEITGKANPLREDLYVNLKIDFRDMDLSPVSPYSGRYLGYNIQKGKLSLDLEYLLVEKKLDSQNRIYLDQLTLGERVDSPDAIKVPVELAITLLKDSQGEIHLDMPVTGDLDDPEFRPGKIVLKMFVNLIIKAATSPFAVLGAIFGGGEELSYLEFEYGLDRIDKGGEKKLGSLIQALQDRTSLKLEIGGFVDTERDREGLRQAIFDKKIKARKLKDMVKKGESVESTDEVTIEANEYEKYLTKAYKQEDFPKPRNVLGIAKKLPVPEMEKLMLTHIVINDDDLRQLASGRARAVKNYILGSEKIEQDRIFLVKPESLQPEEKENLKNSRVDFTLH